MSTKTKPKAASGEAASKPPAEEFWARIDSRCKPSKAVSRDAMMWPVLTNGHISHEKGGSYLYCSDSYMLAAIPIQMDCPSEDRAKLLPEGALIPEALRSLDKSPTGKFRVRDGLVEVDGDRALYPVAPDEGKPPKFRELFPTPKSEPDDGNAIPQIGFNPDLLKRLCEALGVNGAGVALKFIAPLRPIRVEVLSGVPGEGMLMPIRLNI